MIETPAGDREQKEEFRNPSTAEYTINVADLLRDTVVTMLIHSVTPNQLIVRVERDRFDGAGLVLECDGERAKAIVDIIRIKYSRNEIRCYKGTKRI